MLCSPRLMKMEDSVLSIASSGKREADRSCRRKCGAQAIASSSAAAPAVPTGQVYEDDYHIKTNGYVESAVDRDLHCSR